MRINSIKFGLLTSAAMAALVALAAVPASAQPAPAAAVAIDNDDIGGVVRGPNGPEAGVWVIAETRDLPVRFIKIVVTDDQGRYVVPDLPKANYDVWVRGYGLVDSPKVKSDRQALNRTACRPDERSAAPVLPAIYWYAMMKSPDRDQVRTQERTGRPGEGQAVRLAHAMKNNVPCVGCHQLASSRPARSRNYTWTGKTHEEAWVRRIQSGQRRRS